MQIFKDEQEYRQVVFSIDSTLARRLEKARSIAHKHGKTLNVDGVISDILASYLNEAEKQLRTLERREKETLYEPFAMGPSDEDRDIPSDTKDLTVSGSHMPETIKQPEQ